MSASVQACESCGSPIPEGLSASDCPQCLLGLVFGDAKDDEPLPDGSGEARAEWAASPEAKGTEVGPFTLTRKIGEGGMGTV